VRPDDHGFARIVSKFSAGSGFVSPAPPGDSPMAFWQCVQNSGKSGTWPAPWLPKGSPAKSYAKSAVVAGKELVLD
jgi:hypothetical protein